MARERPFALCAVSNVPFGRTIYLKSCGQCLDLTGWTGAMQLRDAPGGTLRLALSTAPVPTNTSCLQVFSVPAVDCFGQPILDYLGNPTAASGVNVLITEADLLTLPIAPQFGDPCEPTVFAYDLVLTDTSGFARRWLFGSFSVTQGVTL